MKNFTQRLVNSKCLRELQQKVGRFTETRRTSSFRTPFIRRVRLRVGATILPLDARIMLIYGMECQLIYGAINHMEDAKMRGDVSGEDQARTLLKDLGVQPQDPDERAEWGL